MLDDKFPINQPETVHEYIPSQEDLVEFFSKVRIEDTEPDPKTGEPKIEITIKHIGYIATLVKKGTIGNIPDGKTYRIKKFGFSSFYLMELPLRDILGEEKEGNFGSMGKVDIGKIHSLKDTWTPYSTAIDYKKLFSIVLREVMKRKNELVQIINTPPHVYELKEFSKNHKAPIIQKIDEANKTVTVSEKTINSLNNPAYPRRIISEIISMDGWKVEYLE